MLKFKASATALDAFVFPAPMRRSPDDESSRSPATEARTPLAREAADGSPAKQTPSLSESLANLGVDPQVARSFLRETLIEPIESFLMRPGKRFRGQLVDIGFRLGLSHELKELTRSAESATRRAQLQLALEALHAGSLIIDDIQDGSENRRGAPALHLEFGVPLALNAGNTLYFWPMELLRELKLEAETELRLYRAFHRVLLRAHCGQALDVGIDVSLVKRTEVEAICLETIRSKTGALVALALDVGAILGGAGDERVALIDCFGHKLGMALQMFDDIANVASLENRLKRLEDLKGLKPSWLWAVATELSERDYRRFVKLTRALSSPSAETEASRELAEFLETRDLLGRARARAHNWLADAIAELGREFPDHYDTLNDVARIGAMIANSYR